SLATIPVVEKRSRQYPTPLAIRSRSYSRGPGGPLRFAKYTLEYVVSDEKGAALYRATPCHCSQISPVQRRRSRLPPLRRPPPPSPRPRGPPPPPLPGRRSRLRASSAVQPSMTACRLRRTLPSGPT